MVSRNEKRYSVKQLSKLAGVSIRTLHYYDEIGLLKPAFRSEKGYRYYQRRELFLLQQIRFYRELDFPLQEIKEIMDDPDFDLISALEFHRRQLREKSAHLRKLMETIDKTIEELTETEGKTMKDTDIYAGFKPEDIAGVREEVIERWGEEELLETEGRIRKMGKEGWKDARRRGEEIDRRIAALMDLDPADVKVQQAIQQHFEYMNTFYEVSKERYRGLAQLYIEDERFTAHYEKTATGLADYIHRAINVFCDNDLQVK